MFHPDPEVQTSHSGNFLGHADSSESSDTSDDADDSYVDEYVDAVTIKLSFQSFYFHFCRVLESDSDAESTPIGQSTINIGQGTIGGLLLHVLPKSNGYCVLCTALHTTTSSLTKISIENAVYIVARFQSWVSTCMFHTFLTSYHVCKQFSASRVCKIHLDDHGLLDFTPDQFVQTTQAVKKSPKILVPQLDVMKLLTSVSCQQYKDRLGSQNIKMINFDDSRMSQSDYVTLTGVKKVEFDQLVTEQYKIRQSKRWSRRNSLGLYLTRARTGN